MPNYTKITNNNDVTERSEGGIQKFNTIGQTAEGKFHRLWKGKYDSNLLQIGNTTYSSSSVLDNNFRDMVPGTQVKVVYKGMRDSAKIGGKAYKDFDIYVDNGLQKAIADVHALRKDQRQVMEGTNDNDLRYTLLLSRVKIAKGENIANILLSATALSNNPYAALVDAVKQMGMQELVTNDEGVPF